MDWAFGQELPTAKQLLLVGLAWLCDDNGVTFKSQSTVAERLNRDSRWVREHLGALAEAGLVTRVRRHRRNGSRTTDLLILNMPRPVPVDLEAYSGFVGEREPGDREPTGENPPGGYRRISVGPTGENPPGHPINHLETTKASVDLDRDVREVFKAWVESTGRAAARTKLTPDRRRVIVRALRSHGLADCLLAVRNIGLDGWASGRNERGRPFNGVEHALGSASRLERWRDYEGGAGGGVVSSSALLRAQPLRGGVDE